MDSRWWRDASRLRALTQLHHLAIVEDERKLHESLPLSMAICACTGLVCTSDKAMLCVFNYSTTTGTTRRGSLSLPSGATEVRC